MRVKYHSFDSYGQLAAQVLLNQIASANWDFDPEGWNVILSAITREGENVRDAGPCALVVYERYVRIALVHLLRFRSLQNARALIHVVMTDLEQMHSTIKKMHRKAFTDNETAAIRKATQQLHISLQALAKQ